MSKLTKVVQKFLQETKSNDFEKSLDTLIEMIENKVDPDPGELYILESLYQLKQKLKIAESKLNSYILQENKSLPSNKLSTLYDSNNGYGTSKLFE